MTKSLKKIIAQQDIDKLKINDLLKVSGYGRMMLNKITEEGEYFFIGRQGSRKTIVEIHSKKEKLWPERNPDGSGNLIADVFYESTSKKNSIISGSEYNERNAALRKRGGI